MQEALFCVTWDELLGTTWSQLFMRYAGADLLALRRLKDHRHITAHRTPKLIPTKIPTNRSHRGELRLSSVPSCFLGKQNRFSFGCGRALVSRRSCAAYLIPDNGSRRWQEASCLPLLRLKLSPLGPSHFPRQPQRTACGAHCATISQRGATIAERGAMAWHTVSAMARGRLWCTQSSE